MAIKPINILFSTTRNWNIGDDFILFGILNLFKSLLNHINPVIYNRNPNLHELRTVFNRLVDLEKDGTYQKINFYTTLKPFLPHYDNSWFEHLDIGLFDLIVFAGTPEWLGGMVQPMITAILQNDIPTLYLGIGSFEGIALLTLDKMVPQDRALLEKAYLITVRDETCKKILSPLEVEQLPCPALFAADGNQQHQRSTIQRVAFSIQGADSKNGQRITKEVFDYAIRLLKLINKHYDCALICHYINEIQELKPFSENVPIYYSYDPRDYISIYNNFDLSITTRIHGAGLCASLGIPSFVITHSARSETVAGFLAETINPQLDDPQQILKKIQDYQIQVASAKLLQHKQETFQHYQQLLKPIFKKLDFI
jgi:polysaccharide pyruvyl transferase WcaK-like protein